MSDCDSTAVMPAYIGAARTAAIPLPEQFTTTGRRLRRIWSKCFGTEPANGPSWSQLVDQSDEIDRNRIAKDRA